jgi:hypothetical protein
LLKEKQKRLQSQLQQEEHLMKADNNKHINDWQVTSPGRASVQSDKEAVQVFVRVRPPFVNEVEEDQNYLHHSPNSEGGVGEQQALWSCVQVI